MVEKQVFNAFGVLVEFLSSPEVFKNAIALETAGAMAVIELTAYAQNGPPPHIHHREDESFYVLDGKFSVVVGGESFEAASGAFVHVPEGILHTYRKIGATPGRMLVILTPGGFENFWRETGDPAWQDSAPPPPPEGIVEKLVALAPRYHLEIPPPDQARS